MSPTSPGLRAELRRDLGDQALRKAVRLRGQVLPELVDTAQDSDGEERLLCRECKLPLGEFGYVRDGEVGPLVHGECMAKVQLDKLRGVDDRRRKEEAAIKQAKRAQYDIGWKVQRIPANLELARKLQVPHAKKDFYCLTWDSHANAVAVAPATEPAAVVNLAYLAVALRVRFREGREPMFSLDPIDTRSTSRQKKTFGPAWLAGTSMGEVMFQADYHLKELSMGEHGQPCLGMRSAFDFFESRARQGSSTKLTDAREWFVVRDASVSIAAERSLIPSVKMGVEAREQIKGANGLEDAPATSADHPLVKYAEEFTRKFDLIAERKSVINQLREVAKASVLAKFMLDSGAAFEEAWLDLVDVEAIIPRSLEIPQLWSERYHSNIQVRDGNIMEDKSRRMKLNGLYGGVEFRLQRFDLSFAAERPPITVYRATSQAGNVDMYVIPALPFASRSALMPGPHTSITIMHRDATFGRAGVFPTAHGASVQLVDSVLPTSGLIRYMINPPTGIKLDDAITRVFGSGVPVQLKPGRKRPVPAIEPPPVRAPVALAERPVPTRAPITVPRAPPQKGWFPGKGKPALGKGYYPAVGKGYPGKGMPMARAASVPPRMTFPTRYQGVDLDLNHFDLSVATTAAAGSADAGGLQGVGDGFWSRLDGAKGEELLDLGEEDRKLLMAVFHPKLSDRREEGGKFLPPTLSPEYLGHLRVLVEEEKALRQQRQEHFQSLHFEAENPGPLFPTSWTCSFEMTSRQATTTTLASPRPGATLQPRPDYLAENALLRLALQNASPTFDRVAEDGVRYRIYRIGSLEVRTIQGDEPNNKAETIGAIFSLRMPNRQGAARDRGVLGGDPLAKVTEYVEWAWRGGRQGAAKQTAHYRSYLVLETKRGDLVLTEMLSDGSMTWEENPPDIDDRSSLAKVLRSCNCRRAHVTAGDLRSYQLRESLRLAGGGTAAARGRLKQYVRGAYRLARGEPCEVFTAWQQGRGAGLAPLCDEEDLDTASEASEESMEPGSPDVVVQATQFNEAAGTCYVVLHMQRGGTIVTEMLEDGTMTWQESQDDLEGRSLAAEVARTADCAAAGFTVDHIRSYQAQEALRLGRLVSLSMRKRYAQGLCMILANGEAAGGPPRQVESAPPALADLGKLDIQATGAAGGGAASRGKKGACASDGSTTAMGSESDNSEEAAEHLGQQLAAVASGAWWTAEAEQAWWQAAYGGWQPSSGWPHHWHGGEAVDQ